MLRLSVNQYEKQVPGPGELISQHFNCHSSKLWNDGCFIGHLQPLRAKHISLSHGNYYTKPSNPLDRILGFCKLLAD